jgi:hypothetical protein
MCRHWQHFRLTAHRHVVSTHSPCVSQLVPPLTFAKMATIATADSMLKNVQATVARLTGGEYFKLAASGIFSRT